MEPAIRQELQTSTGIELPEANWKIRLFEEIEYLLQHDFHKLISILYRMDVSEGKLRGLLQSNPDSNAAEVIAAMMLERAAQRQQTKKDYSTKRDENDTEERW